MKISALDYIYSSIAKYPNKVAVQDRVSSYSFLELSKLAAAISLELGDSICGKPVLVYMPKSCEAVIAFAGVLHAGGFYAPIDIFAPKSRQKTIIDILAPAKVISSLCYREELDSLGITEVLFVDELSYLPEVMVPTSAGIDTDPCYVMFTSGSTGKPKGVVVPHRGVIDYIDWAIETLKPMESDIIGSQAPLFFDNSTLDIYLSWSSGATLDLIPENSLMFASILVEHLLRQGVTWVFFVPSVLGSIATQKALVNTIPKLRMVIFAGEVMPTKVLSYWQMQIPDARFINLYGPTEITVDCTWFEVDREYKSDEVLPIGFACRNTDILILDEQDIVCEKGQIGELCVRGSSLALGYINDIERSAQVFQQNPMHSIYYDRIYRTGDLVWERVDGCLIFSGRKDYQIKYRGYRIELGEIEVASFINNRIINSVALYDAATQTIALIFESETEMSDLEIRKMLSERLPKYMLPRKFLQIEKMPMTANGKIDRSILHKLVF